MSAVLQSLQKAGVKTQENSWNSDAAIVWSVLWHGRMQANRPLYEHYRSQNKPVVVIDIGTLIRGTTWKVAVNHINAQGYYGHKSNLDWDRPKKLKLSLGSNSITNNSIMIAVQHRNSLQMQEISSVEAWINQQVDKIRQHSDRPIVVRPHPRSFLNQSLLPDTVSTVDPVPLANTYDSFDFSTAWHAIVNHNSGPGILAGIAGSRPVVDQSSLAYPVSVAFDQLEQPYLCDREQWFTEVCHTEYTVPELENGLWLKRIESAL
jgi:hypothetical protein